jgi:hypothetical protein
MPVTIATGKNLKRVSTFINRYGQVQEGSIHQNLGGYEMGRTPVPDKLAEETGGDKEKKEE